MGNSRAIAARLRISRNTGVSTSHRRKSIAISPKIPPSTNGTDSTAITSFQRIRLLTELRRFNATEIGPELSTRA
jgi:hypothetical protein